MKAIRRLKSKQRFSKRKVRIVNYPRQNRVTVVKLAAVTQKRKKKKEWTLMRLL